MLPVTSGEDFERLPLLLVPRGRHRMTLARRAAYGVGHVLNDICAALWFSYTLLFLQVVLGMAPILAGALLMIGQVADAVATPFVGFLTDRFATKKLWHMAGTALVVLSFPLLFETCFDCKPPPTAVDTNVTSTTPAVLEEFSLTWLSVAYYVLLIVTFQIGWAVVQISHLSLIPDLTSKQSERAELTAIRYTANVCSGVTVYVITWCVFHATRIDDERSKIGPSDAYKFGEIVLIGIVIGLVCSVWFHVGLRTSARPQMRSSSSQPTLRTRRTVHSFFQSPLLLQVAALYVASRMFLSISLVYIPLFLDEGLDGDGEILASIPLASYIASFIASLAIKQYNSRCGSKVTNLLGALICIAGCIWIGYGLNGENSISEMYGIAVLLGAGSSITTVSSLCITADLIGKETETGAFVYSTVTFADKLFTGIAVIVIEYLKCPSKDLCPRYYRDVLTYVCGGSALLGILVLATLAPIPLGNRVIDDLSYTDGFQPELLTPANKTSLARSKGLVLDPASPT